MTKKNMEVPDPNRSIYLGMAKGDLDDVWYAKYWNPHMGPLPKQITEALAAGPQAALMLPAVEDAASLAENGYQAFENGFGVTEDGAAVVAALTQMPNVTPAMLDWWFGWHGSDTRRYKLWNPDAHLYACWKDGIEKKSGCTDREMYINRTSFIDEYVGSTKMSLAIKFVSPSVLGFNENILSDAEQATVICGQVGLSEIPIDSGYLVHYVRRTRDGSEMRSRFWLGGKYLASSNNEKILPETTTRNEAFVIWQAYSLLVHCSKEMKHLAAFLPDLYGEFHNAARSIE
jgi:hypothetical protein